MLDVAQALVATTSNAPLDWVYGTAASVLFVVVIAVPAAVLNSRDHRRLRAERSSEPRAGAPSEAGATRGS
ncbi:MAG: hypothetical protein M0005_09415 [Actinomycetota bacterium]|jgi:hypothetical protein|nr:hypothetical protein [Actinomycetota bacterium]